MEKSYDEEDFVTFDYDLGGDLPNINYESISKIDPVKGLVISNEERYTFELAEKT